MVVVLITIIVIDIIIYISNTTFIIKVIVNTNSFYL